MFRLRAFVEKIEASPYKLSIESSDTKDIEFLTSVGKASIGVSGTYSPAGRAPAPSIKAISYLEIEVEPSITPIDALKIIRRIEHLISLLTFDFIKTTNAHLTITVAEKDGTKSDKQFRLDRAKFTKNAKTEFERHEVPLNLNEFDFGSVVSRFFEISDAIEQTLNWYRIVTAEDRYLEDKFFYCVRMIDALYKALAIKTAIDQAAVETLETIIGVLTKSEENEALVEFLRKRAIPNFSRSSFSNVLEDLRSKYAEIKVAEILDPKIINRLRGKEAHGSTQPFTPQESQFMAYSYEIIRVLYILIVLENCGIPRDFLLKRLKASHHFHYLFEEERLKALRIHTSKI